MSQSASQAQVFYIEVARSRCLWTIRDEGGFPAPKASWRRRATPFWSSPGRVDKIISNVPAYSGFAPYELSWSDFDRAWIPGLVKDKYLVGVNWSGLRAVGYDVEPLLVREMVNRQIQRMKS